MLFLRALPPAMPPAPSYGLILTAADRRPCVLVNVCDPANTIVKNLLRLSKTRSGTRSVLWFRARVTASGVRGRRFLAVLWPKTVEIVRAGLKKRHIRVSQKTRSQNMPPILVIYIMRFTEELYKIVNPLF